MNTSLSRLQTFYGDMDASELLRVMITEEFAGKITLVSSFGSGSALLLSLVAEVDTDLPVLFLDTKKHFPETLEYVETLKKHLGLTNVKFLEPRVDLVKNIDPGGELWNSQPNRCCWLRKVEPLQRELKEGEYKALITGRKRYQTAQRAEMDTIEMNEDGRFRINPLALWDKKRLDEELKKRKLPEHPLVKKGYLSIGCAPCTKPVKKGEDERAGRWAHTGDLPGGEQKVECGIHVGGKPEWNI